MLYYVIFSYAHAHGLTFKCLPSTYPFADPFVVHLFLYMSFSIPSLQLGDAPPSSSSRVAQKISLCPPLEYVTGQDSIRLGEFRNPIHSQHLWPMTTDPFTLRACPNCGLNGLKPAKRIGYAMLCCMLTKPGQKFLVSWTHPLETTSNNCRSIAGHRPSRAPSRAQFSRTRSVGHSLT
jgi:hypothetical protein